MSGAILLPGINRGFPHSASVNADGIIAYASRNLIYLVDPRPEIALFLDSNFISHGRSKVTNVSFCKMEDCRLLAALDESKDLKVWDINTRTCVATKKCGNYVDIFEWIHGSTVIVFPADEKSSISKWNVNTHHCSKFKLDSCQFVSEMKSNPHLPELLAIGFLNGMIYVLNVVSGMCIQKFKVHTTKISCLKWSPIVPENLLSVSLDLSIRVWKLEEDAPIFTHYVQVPRHTADNDKRIQIVATFHPTKPDAAICCNLNGNMGEINFFDSKQQLISYSGGFLKFPVCVLLAEGKKKSNLVYLFNNYKISLWNTDTKSCIKVLEFVSGYVYETDVSPFHYSMSFCCGDGFIRLWNPALLSDPDKVAMVSIFVQSKSRIMTASWHPIHEHIIAFGTSEGRVGIIDINKRKVLSSYESHHTETVYHVCWGPLTKITNTDDVDHLYSCGGGSTLIHKYGSYKEKALNFDDLIELPSSIKHVPKRYSEIVWNFDYSLFSAGTYEGTFDLYAADFSFVARYILPIKGVESLKWHPPSTYFSSEGSPLKSWIGCSGNDVNIYIVDTDKIKGPTENEGEPSIYRPDKELVGHNKKIVSLAWSQHNDGILASASKDGSAVIWNAVTETIIATYTHHNEVVLSVVFSPIDHDIVFSTGQDFSVRMWKISEQTPKVPPSKTPRNKIRKVIKKETDRKENKNDAIEDTDETVSTISSKAKIKKAPIVELTNNMIPQVLANEADETISQQKKEKKKTCLFSPDQLPLEQSWKNVKHLADFHSSERCEAGSFDSVVDPQPLSLRESISSSFDDQTIVDLGVFMDQVHAQKAFEIQNSCYKEKYPDIVNFPMLCIGNIKSVIEEAASREALSPYLVSLAPMVSHQFYFQICETYAMQLIEKGLSFEACVYLKGCGKIHTAIRHLEAKGRYLDALGLARACLPDGDQVLAHLYSNTLRKSNCSSDTIRSTKCLLALDRPLSAAKSAAFKNDANGIRIAAYICKKFGFETEAQEYLIRCVDRCLVNCDWAVFDLLVEDEPSMKPYGPLVLVHQLLYHNIRYLKKEDGFTLKNVFITEDSLKEIKFWHGSLSVDSNSSFISHVISRLMTEFKDVNFEEIAKLLETFLQNRKSSAISTDAHVNVAIFITQFVLQCILENHDAAAKVFLQIFEISDNIVFLPKVLCSIMFPVELHWDQFSNSVRVTYLPSEHGNTEEKVVAIYNKICNSFHSCFENFGLEFHEINHADSVESRENFSHDLHSAIQQMRSNFNEKHNGNYIMAYFVASLMNDLAKMADKKDAGVKCYELIKFEKPENNTKLQTCQKSEVGKEDIVHNENILSDYVSVNDLIQQVLKEAEEKADSFRVESDSSSESSIIQLDPDEAEKKELQIGDNERKDPKEASIEGNVNELKDIDTEQDCSAAASSGSSDENGFVLVKQPVIPEPDSDGSGIIVLAESDSDNQHLEPNKHNRCLNKIDVFYRLMCFVAENTCVDEYAVKYYLKSRLDLLSKAISVKQVDQVLKTKKESISKVQEDKLNKEKCTKKEIKSISEEADDSLSNAIESAKDNESAKKEDILNDHSEHLAPNEVKVSEADGLAGHVDEVLPKKETLISYSSSTIESSAYDDLRKEYTNVFDLLTSIQESENYSNPNPFEIASKVMQACHSVIGNSSCDVVNARLHDLVHNILNWKSKFTIESDAAVCIICKR